MSNYAFNYSFNVTGNCNAVVQEISENVGRLRERVEQTTGSFAKMEKSLIVFNQAQQYFDGLKQTLESTLAPGAALNATKDISDLIDALQPIERIADDCKRESERICDYKIVSDNNENYSWFRDGNAIMTTRRLTAITSLHNEFVYIQQNWLSGEKANAGGENREIAPACTRFYMNNTSKSGVYIINAFREVAETNIKYNDNICQQIENAIQRIEIERWLSLEKNGLLCHGRYINQDQKQEAKSIGSKSDVSSIIFRDMATLRFPDYIQECAIFNTLKGNEKIEITGTQKQSDKSTTNISTFFAEWNMLEHKSHEQSAISKSLSNVCRLEQSTESTSAERRVINLHVDKVIDGITIYHAAQDFKDEEVKEQLEQIVTNSLEKLLTNEMYE